MNYKIRRRLIPIFKKIFKDESITINDNTTSKDIKGWDSLTHVGLIIAVENEFSICFSSREILSINRHLDLEELVEKKLK